VPPKYGTVELDADTGKFVYTPHTALAEPGITDRFVVTVDNGARARLPGLAGVMQEIAHSFAVALGIAQPDTIDREIALSVVGTGRYGSLENGRYWAQQHFGNCALMATSMAVAQVTGQHPLSEMEMIELAKQTDSIVSPGRWVFLDERIEEGAYARDVARLMEQHFDVTAEYHRAGTYDEDGRQITAPTAADGQEAFTEIKAALAQGSAVMASVNSTTIWTAVYDYTPGAVANWTRMSHEVVVIAVDMDRGFVYLNDSGAFFGRAMKVPVGTFLNAWQSGNYEHIIVSANHTDA
jgi:hypothetical protein